MEAETRASKRLDRENKVNRYLITKIFIFCLTFAVIFGLEWHLLAKYEPEFATELALEQAKDKDGAHQALREYYAFRDVILYLINPIILIGIICLFFLSDIRHVGSKILCHMEMKNQTGQSS